MAIIPKFYIDAVASIGINQNGDTCWIGTGFFVQKKVQENKYLLFLITNKHVIANQSSIIIRMRHKETSELKSFSLSLRMNSTFVVHPDEKVDIAAIILDGAAIDQIGLECSAFDIDTNILTMGELKERGFDCGSGVFMLGYPLGLVNVDSNSPICRRGCVARFDLSEIESSKNILLDIQNFPGNSGGPIVSEPELVSIEGTPALGQSILVGIIHSYIPYQDELLSRQTGRVVEIRTENSGLAKANPSECIRETIAPIIASYYEKNKQKELLPQ